MCDFSKGIYLEPPKTVIKIGEKNSYLEIRVDKRFNKFQKKMMNWCFGWVVEDIEEGK